MILTRQGIIQSSSPPISTKIGNGLKGGSTKYMQTTFNSVLARTFTQKWSMSFWLKTGTLSGFQILQEFNDFVGYFVRFSGSALEVGLVNSGVSAFTVWTSGGGGFANNTLYHITITYSGSNTFKIYKDAVDTGASNTNASGVLTNTTPTVNMNLGGRTTSFSFTGIFYDICLFNDELTQAQINKIYINNIYPSGILFRLKLEEHSGTTAADSSGNGLATNLNNYNTTLGASNDHVDYLGNPIT